jgi:DNA-directed RNA polymerase beta subunit
MRRKMPSQSAISGVRDSTANFRIGNHSLAFAVCCYACLLVGILLAGCTAVSSPAAAHSQQLSDQEELSAPYDQITLKKSLTLDALPKILRSQSEPASRLAGTELVSHSDRVVASLGQSPDGYSTWFNMVTFHEYRLNVIRKYFFVVDDRAGSLRTRSRRGLRFDCEMVLGKEVLGESYTSENARRIAMLRYVLDSICKDIKELGDDIDVPGQYNKKLDVCGMLINQMFETVLVKLEASPVLAMRLSRVDGAEFDHINFNKGTIRMVVTDDTVAVRARFGAFAHNKR